MNGEQYIVKRSGDALLDHRGQPVRECWFIEEFAALAAILRPRVEALIRHSSTVPADGKLVTREIPQPMVDMSSLSDDDVLDILDQAAVTYITKLFELRVTHPDHKLLGELANRMALGAGRFDELRRSNQVAFARRRDEVLLHVEQMRQARQVSGGDFFEFLTTLRAIKQAAGDHEPRLMLRSDMDDSLTTNRAHIKGTTGSEVFPGFRPVRRVYEAKGRLLHEPLAFTGMYGTLLMVEGPIQRQARRLLRKVGHVIPETNMVPGVRELFVAAEEADVDAAIMTANYVHVAEGLIRELGINHARAMGRTGTNYGTKCKPALLFSQMLAGGGEIPITFFIEDEDGSVVKELTEPSLPGDICIEDLVFFVSRRGRRVQRLLEERGIPHLSYHEDQDGLYPALRLFS